MLQRSDWPIITTDLMLKPGLDIKEMFLMVYAEIKLQRVMIMVIFLDNHSID